MHLHGQTLSRDFIKNDLMLLEHEYFELKFEKNLIQDMKLLMMLPINAGYKWNPLFGNKKCSQISKRL